MRIKGENMRSADYVEMTTTSIAGSGAGAVTCTQITNLPTFTLVFGSQNTTCRYVIEDTVNKKFETGIGAVAANVLTRTKPQITWDGTTWSALNPSALTFTGSPTSGDIKIRLSATAETSVGAMPMLQSTVAGDSIWRDYPVSHNNPFSNGGSGVALTADREYYSPYYIQTPGVLTAAQFEVITSVASSNLKWALYACGSDGLPGAKVVDFVTTSTASTGVKTDTATASWTPAGKVHLAPGWYYIGFISGHAISLRFASGGNGVVQTNPLGRKDGYGYGSNIYVAGSYTTGLPATPSLGSATMSGSSSSGVVFIGLKVVA
jgi:hypothetical protein